MADRILTAPHRRVLPALLALLGFALFAPGCSSPTPAPAGFQRVVLDGTPFTLELVSDNDTRTVGLGGRTELPEDGGMLFSFPNARVRQFVMRDCLIDIDIIFLDAAGRIVAMHAMTTEEPRRPDESALAYETRLKRYSSRFAAQYAIEIRGGLIAGMSLKEGDKVNLDTDYLKEVTR